LRGMIRIRFRSIVTAGEQCNSLKAECFGGVSSRSGELQDKWGDIEGRKLPLQGLGIFRSSQYRTRGGVQQEEESGGGILELWGRNLSKMKPFGGARCQRKKLTAGENTTEEPSKEGVAGGVLLSSVSQLESLEYQARFESGGGEGNFLTGEGLMAYIL